MNVLSRIPEEEDGDKTIKNTQRYISKSKTLANRCRFYKVPDLAVEFERREKEDSKKYNRYVKIRQDCTQNRYYSTEGEFLGKIYGIQLSKKNPNSINMQFEKEDGSVKNRYYDNTAKFIEKYDYLENSNKCYDDAHDKAKINFKNNTLLSRRKTKTKTKSRGPLSFLRSTFSSSSKKGGKRTTKKHKKTKHNR